jgi:hypothetical protein
MVRRSPLRLEACGKVMSPVDKTTGVSYEFDFRNSMIFARTTLSLTPLNGFMLLLWTQVGEMETRGEK